VALKRAIFIGVFSELYLDIAHIPVV